MGSSPSNAPRLPTEHESNSQPTSSDSESNGNEHGTVSKIQSDAQRSASKDAEDHKIETACENIDFAVSLLLECKSEVSIENLNATVDRCRQNLNAHPIGHPRHYDCIRNLISAFNERFVYTNEIRDWENSYTLSLELAKRIIVDSTPEGSPPEKHALVTLDLSNNRMHSLPEMQKSVSVNTLNNVVFLVQESLDILFQKKLHAKHSVALLALADASYIRHLQNGELVPLDGAVLLLDDALTKATYTETAPLDQSILPRLWLLLQAQIGVIPALQNIEATIKLIDPVNLGPPSITTGEIQTPMSFIQQKSAELGPHFPYSHRLNAFSVALHDIFIRGGHQRNLNEAIVLYRAIICKRFELIYSNPSYYAIQRNQLGLAHLARYLLDANFYERKGRQDITDLREAIDFFQDAINLSPPPDPNLHLYMWNFAQGLSLNLGEDGQQKDYEEAIAIHERLLRLIPRHSRGELLPQVLLSLMKLTEKNKHSNTEDGVKILRHVLNLLADISSGGNVDLNFHTFFAVIENLCIKLLDRFYHSWQVDDLDELISLFRKVLELEVVPQKHSAMLDIISAQLAIFLQARYDKTHQRRDLDEAIVLLRQAVDKRTSLGDAFYRGLELSNVLIGALRDRYVMEPGRKGDLDEAETLCRQELELPFNPHDTPGQTLRTRFGLCVILLQKYSLGLQDERNLDETLTLTRQVISEFRSQQDELWANDPTLLSFLTCLPMGIFELYGQEYFLDEAIALQRDYIRHVTSCHVADQRRVLSGLATALATKFGINFQPEHHDEAISLRDKLFQITPPGHYTRHTVLKAFGKSYVKQYLHLNRQDEKLLEAGMAAYSSAALCSGQVEAFAQIQFGKTWSRHADNNKHPIALQAYDYLLKTLMLAVSFSTDTQSRQQALSLGTDGIARQAACCAIREARFEKAIENLEAGRAIAWSQMLQLRPSFDQLFSVAPKLADRMRTCASELERGSHRNVHANLADTRRKIALDEESFRLERLNEEWIESLDEVRKIKGFEDFLKPRRISSLMAAAATCPIVFLIPDDEGSHCLVMTSTDIHHIPLSGLPKIKLQLLALYTHAASTSSLIEKKVIDAIIMALKLDHQPDSFTAELFRDQNIAEPERLEAKRVTLGLTGNATSVLSDTIFKYVLRTLWLEVVKPVITFLKLEKSTNRTILQWCPSGLFTALPIHAAGCYDSGMETIESTSDYIISSYTPTVEALLVQDQRANTDDQLKVLAIADTTNLYSTTQELDNIKKHVPIDCLVQLGVGDAPAHVETVLSHLPTASIVHFACHGKQDTKNPLSSALFLDDGELTISKIMERPLPNGSLAFLCACETQRGISAYRTK